MLLDLRPDARALLNARDWPALRAALADTPPPDLADLLLGLEGSERVLLFRALGREQAAEAVAYLDPEPREALLRALTDDEARAVLADLSPDDRAELLGELPGTVTQRLLNLLSPEDLQEARTLLGYPEDSVGRLMTPNYVAVRAHWTTEQVLRHVRRKGRLAETVNRVFVVDEDWRLRDDFTLRQLVLAEPEKPIEGLLNGVVVSVPATADREEAVRLVQRYDLTALPVVDSAGVLVGIVTVDDLFDVAEEEATEDFHKGASVAPLGRSLLSASAAYLYKKRVGWLFGLVLMNVFSGAGIAFFEDTIAAYVSLVFFLPLLIDSGGNAGSQSATLMVRALATGDVRMTDWMRLLGREVGVALLLGVTMAAGVALVASFRAPEVMAVVALTMVIVVLIGSLIGMLLPFILTKLKLDPATASAPLITSIADICGVLIYFSIATWLLGL